MNTATAAAVGTSPEVLQHYLTTGIALLTPKGPAKLVGINAGFFQCPVEVELLADEQAGHILSGRYNFNYEEVIPMLRPFSQITEPVYDGFIPAITTATFLANDWAARYHFAVHEIKGNRVTVRQFEWDEDLGEVPLADYSILADWNFIKENMDGSLAHCENLLDAYEYLRGQHFAVNLDAHQFIEAAPSTPTREADNTSSPTSI